MSILGDVKVSGNSLITCSDDRSMRISHLTANTRVSEFSYEGLALNNILQHTSGDIYLSSDDGKVIRVLPSGRTADIYDYHRSPVRALAEVRDGLVASGDRSGEVLVWPPGRSGPVRRVQLGRRVIALADARPFGDLLAVTENEVSIIDLPPSPAASRDADGCAPSASHSAPSLLARTSGPNLGTIIHLSDLHFHGGEPADSWLSPLLEDLERELSVSRVDLLVVSGDVSSVAAESEYAAAAKFLAELRSALGSPPILLTPGNHDLSWAASKRAYVPKRRGDLTSADLQQAMIEASPDYVEIAQPDDLRTRFQAFVDFHLEVTGHAYSLSPEKQVSSVALPALRVAVWGLNSSWQIDHHYTSRASINRSALARVLGETRELDAHGQGWTKLIVWHHPARLPGEENIANPEVLEQLSKAGFRVLLHGHIHKPSRDLYQYDVTGDRGIASAGAGTFGALTQEWTPGFPLGYNCIDVHQVSLVVRSRKRESPDGAWMADARWRTGPQRDPVSWFFINR
jgi:UDP-2,3-diacylglucosamine pyrophosphatase LpxH